MQWEMTRMHILLEILQRKKCYNDVDLPQITHKFDVVLWTKFEHRMILKLFCAIFINLCVLHAFFYFFVRAL